MTQPGKKTSIYFNELTLDMLNKIRDQIRKENEHRNVSMSEAVAFCVRTAHREIFLNMLDDNDD